MSSHTIAIEDDNIQKGRKMVVFRNRKGEVIGIPLRGVSAKTAADAKNSLRYAFDYGIRETMKVYQSEAYNILFNLGCASK